MILLDGLRPHGGGRLVLLQRAAGAARRARAQRAQATRSRSRRWSSRTRVCCGCRPTCRRSSVARPCRSTKATITDVSHAASDPSQKVVNVLFNPTDLSVDRGSHYASMPVPGLSMPILQYIRGESDVLHLELFLDRTDQSSDIESDIVRARRLS